VPPICGVERIALHQKALNFRILKVDDWEIHCCPNPKKISWTKAALCILGKTTKIALKNQQINSSAQLELSECGQKGRELFQSGTVSLSAQRKVHVD
jgi:hypothetical protein